MMTEISLNILDIAQNSVRAGSKLIHISVIAGYSEDKLTVNIDDDGCGMDKEQLAAVTDPFFTTRTTRKVGLGVPFFKEAAEDTGGYFEISSVPGKGTKVKAVFGLSHIDRMPLGDITATIHSLITFNQNIDFIFQYQIDDRSFTVDTREFRAILGDVPFDSPEVSKFIKDYLNENKVRTDNGVEL